LIDGTELRWGAKGNWVLDEEGQRYLWGFDNELKTVGRVGDGAHETAYRGDAVASVSIPCR